MDIRDKLKRCPFCGGRPELMKIDIPEMRVIWRVECRDCGASTWPRLVSRDFAVSSWNSRLG